MIKRMKIHYKPFMSEPRVSGPHSSRVRFLSIGSIKDVMEQRAQTKARVTLTWRPTTMQMMNGGWQEFLSESYVIFMSLPLRSHSFPSCRFTSWLVFHSIEKWVNLQQKEEVRIPAQQAKERLLKARHVLLYLPPSLLPVVVTLRYV